MRCCNARKGLHQLRRGCRARIVANECCGVIGERFEEMGLTCGALISLVRVAPLGDPVVVRIRDYELILRKSECSGITVEEEE